MGSSYIYMEIHTLVRYFYIKTAIFLSITVVVVTRWSPPWWRHQMETFPALLAICAGNSPVTGEFPAQRPVTQSFDVFFYLRLNKRLSKQSWGWWFETPPRPLWCHCNAKYSCECTYVIMKHTVVIDILNISCETICMWNLMFDQPTLVQAMPWFRQTTSHYPNQYW